MATNNSGLNLTYLLISKKRRERERGDRQRARINRRTTSKKFLQTCLLVAVADRVLCNLIMFNSLFALE